MMNEKMKKQYETPSFKVIKIELDRCIAINTSDINAGPAGSQHTNVNGGELTDDNWGDVVDLSPKKKSRW